MNRDGTPETDLEQWVLEMGLGHYYAVISDTDLTKAQAEKLTESTLDPKYNGKHALLFDLLVYNGDPNNTGEAEEVHRQR